MIEAIQNLPRPTTLRNIKQFLGLAGYYRRFIKDFSARAKPLLNLSKKEALYKWGPEEEKALKTHDKLWARALYYNILISKNTLQ